MLDEDLGGPGKHLYMGLFIDRSAIKQNKKLLSQQRMILINPCTHPPSLFEQFLPGEKNLLWLRWRFPQKSNLLLPVILSQFELS